MKSKSNTRTHIAAKRAWYDQHGVNEYYEYDPTQGTFRAWLRNETGKLEAVLHGAGMVSPALGIRFILNGSALELLGPDGRILGDYVSAESAAETERIRAEAADDRAESEKARAETEKARAESEKARADAAEAELAALRLTIPQNNP